MHLKQKLTTVVTLFAACGIAYTIPVPFRKNTTSAKGTATDAPVVYIVYVNGTKTNKIIMYLIVDNKSMVETTSKNFTTNTQSSSNCKNNIATGIILGVLTLILACGVILSLRL